MTDADLEAAIQAEWSLFWRLCDENDKEAAKQTFEQLRKLIQQRSPEQIEALERRQGLR